MGNKYYTPSIEEFHVGFEYEARPKGGGMDYIPFICHGHNSLASEFNSSVIRVKYLDREDIESLGWEPIDGGPGIGLDHWDIGNTWSLYFYNNTPVISIDKGIFPNRSQYFRGRIKNKSQLKFIMKCLGILE